MSPRSRNKLHLVNKARKAIGQLESVLKGRNHDEECSEILHRLSAVRGAVNSLIAELIEDHNLSLTPKNSNSAQEAAEDMIQIVRTHLR